MIAQAKGRFITLEGGEGAGKSVQAKRLEERLAGLGLKVVRTREPGGSPGAEALREAILSGSAAEFGPAAQALMFAAARIDHLDKTILPALERGAWVVSDRFANSTRAYQGAAGNLPAAFIAAARAADRRREQARPDADPRPSRRSRPRAGVEAAAGRETPTASRRKALAFHQTLRRAFLDIAAAEPQRCAVIDAAEERRRGRRGDLVGGRERGSIRRAR